MAADVLRTFFAQVNQAAGAQGAYRISPMLPNDSLDEVRFVLRSSAAHADVLAGVDVRIQLYLLDAAPGTAVAELQNGLPLLDATVPMEPTGANAGVALGYLRYEVPTVHIAGQRYRFLGCVLTSPTNVGLAGSLLAKVFRRRLAG